MPRSTDVPMSRSTDDPMSRSTDLRIPRFRLPSASLLPSAPAFSMPPVAPVAIPRPAAPPWLQSSPCRQPYTQPPSSPTHSARPHLPFLTNQAFSPAYYPKTSLPALVFPPPPASAPAAPHTAPAFRTRPLPFLLSHAAACASALSAAPPRLSPTPEPLAISHPPHASACRCSARTAGGPAFPRSKTARRQCPCCRPAPA